MQSKDCGGGTVVQVEPIKPNRAQAGMLPAQTELPDLACDRCAGSSPEVSVSLVDEHASSCR